MGRICDISASNRESEIKQMAVDALWEMIVAPASADNRWNGEADIIQLQDGRLLLGWTEFYAGSSADDAPARLTGRISADGGKSWGEKYTLVENDGGCNVLEVSFLRLTNGDIALFHLQKNTKETDCRIMMRISIDDGQTFGPAKQLSPDNLYTGLTNGRCIRLRSGRILLEAYDGIKKPIETWDGEWGGTCYCCLSDDEGATWHDSGRIRPADTIDAELITDERFRRGGKSHGGEHACIELKDGSVMMLMRTALDGQYKSISEDGGETWSTPVPTQLKGTPAPIAVSRILTTGDLLAIWNNNLDTPRSSSNRNRTPLTSAISTDEGETWEHFRNIEEHSTDADAWAYPAVTWVGDRALVTYFAYCKDSLPLKLTALSADWFYG